MHLVRAERRQVDRGERLGRAVSVAVEDVHAQHRLVGRGGGSSGGGDGGDEPDEEAESTHQGRNGCGTGPEADGARQRRQQRYARRGGQGGGARAEAARRSKTKGRRGNGQAGTTSLLRIHSIGDHGPLLYLLGEPLIRRGPPPMAPRRMRTVRIRTRTLLPTWSHVIVQCGVRGGIALINRRPDPLPASQSYGPNPAAPRRRHA